MSVRTSLSSIEMTRSTVGSNASAIAGGKLRPGEDPENATVRGPVGAGTAMLGIVPPSAVERDAISNGSCGATVRVEFGMTVFLKRSLLGFSSGGAAGLASAAGFSVAASLALLRLK